MLLLDHFKPQFFLRIFISKLILKHVRIAQKKKKKKRNWQISRTVLKMLIQLNPSSLGCDLTKVKLRDKIPF